MIENGDIIEIDIPKRTIDVKLTEEELSNRRKALETNGGFKPSIKRKRKVSKALRIYSKTVSNASAGAIKKEI